MATAQRLAQAHKLLGMAETLSKLSRFNSEECRVLVHYHQRIVDCMGGLDRLRFRDVLHTTFDITDDLMLDLLFKAFDRDVDAVVDEAEWVRGLSQMIRGNLDEQADFVYFVYDMNGDRSLAREELFQCLKGCMHSGYGIENDEIEECERDIVEITMRKLDMDRDGQITAEDFMAAVQSDPLLLQSCGSCLPSPKSMAAFLALITFKYRSYEGIWSNTWSSAELTTSGSFFSQGQGQGKGAKPGGGKGGRHGGPRASGSMAGPPPGFGGSLQQGPSSSAKSSLANFAIEKFHSRESVMHSLMKVKLQNMIKLNGVNGTPSTTNLAEALQVRLLQPQPPPSPEKDSPHSAKKSSKENKYKGSSQPQPPQRGGAASSPVQSIVSMSI